MTVTDEPRNLVTISFLYSLFVEMLVLLTRVFIIVEDNVDLGKPILA